MHPSRALSTLLLLLLGVACGANEAEDPASDAVDPTDGEPAENESALVAITQPDETAPASSLAAAPLDHAHVSFIDVRGVGDSGWSKTHEKVPIAAQFGAALDRFDRTGEGYRGDLSFINWETVVGNGCTQFGTAYSPGRSYAFVSRPENLTQAHERGFNLIGMSNNHSRDCYASNETSEHGEVASADMTAKSLAALGDMDWATAGISASADRNDASRVSVHAFTIKGRTVRVALGSLYLGRPDCPRAGCAGDTDALFRSFRAAQADLRILALHSMGPTDQDELVRTGVRFVEDFGGDVVYGSGPHVWKPVRVVRKKDGSGKGVVFESLGNFLHPSLGAQAKNFIGRALFDPQSLKLRQVQLLPVANSGSDVRWSTADATSIESNLRWTRLPESRTAVFANVTP